MPPADHAAIKQLFAAAVARSPAERAEFLAAHATDTPDLVAEVRSLLRFHSEDDTLGLDAQAPAAIPDRIGEFRIVALLGEGGMGTVYRAQQDHPRREVALKVVRQGIGSARALRRFEHEAEILGRLQHPGIAQIHAAGRSASGAPFFAMELVDGMRLDQYVQARGLGTRARLEIFAQICDAVHHAHQKGVIHCDLKPGNILVDARGQPKVLDFGVARATDHDLQVTTLRTDVRQLVGTLPYMSPEQAAADVDQLDVRSDVYALGVICYQLLCDRLPLEVGGKSLVDALRTIQTADPTPLTAHDRTLRGDLATIAHKAIEKDKSRRYQSALELAADVRRYLHHQPVAARPASVAYQLAKFARRHRALVTATAALLATLVLGIAGTLTQLANARASARTAQQSSAFLQRMLRSIDPTYAGTEVKLADVVRKAADDIDASFAASPRACAEMHYTLGCTLRGLGLYGDAERELERALAIGSAHAGASDREVLICAGELAMARLGRGRYQQAERELRATVAAARRTMTADDVELLRLLRNHAFLLDKMRVGTAAEPLAREALAGFVRACGENHRDTLSARITLITILAGLGRVEEVDTLLPATHAACVAVLGPEHPESLIAEQHRISHLLTKGELHTVLEALDPLIERMRRILGPEHDYTLITVMLRAMALKKLQRVPEAESLLVQLVEARMRTLGERHPDTAAIKLRLAELYCELGRPADAEPLITGVLEFVRAELPPHSALAIGALNQVALLRFTQGRPEEALPYLQEAVQIERSQRGDDDPSTAVAMNNLGIVLMRLRRFEEAEPLLRAVLARNERVLGSDSRDTLIARMNVAGMLSGSGRLQEGTDLLREVLADQRRLFGDGDAQTLQTAHNLGGNLVASGQHAEAESLYLEVAQGRAEALGPEHRATRETRAQLVLLYEKMGKEEEALAQRAILGVPPRQKKP